MIIFVSIAVLIQFFFLLRNNNVYTLYSRCTPATFNCIWRWEGCDTTGHWIFSSECTLNLVLYILRDVHMRPIHMKNLSTIMILRWSSIKLVKHSFLSLFFHHASLLVCGKMDGKQQWKARGSNVMYGWVRSLLSKRRILSGIPIFHISTSIRLA